MELIDEILSFTREYINNVKERTPERKAKIRTVYRLLTGEKVRPSCSTCYIEALLVINKKSRMEPCKYHLKEGRRLMARGDWSKIMTNKNITNELAEWHLKHNPRCVNQFDRMPGVEPPVNVGFRTILPKPEPVPEITPKIVSVIPSEKVIPGEPKKVAKPVKKKRIVNLKQN